MIDWSILLQGAGAVALIGLFGIAVKGLFDANGTVMGTLLEDVKNLRADSTEADKRFALMNERLQTAQTALLECMMGRSELARELKDHRLRIAELEASLTKHTGLEAPP